MYNHVANGTVTTTAVPHEIINKIKNLINPTTTAAPSHPKIKNIINPTTAGPSYPKIAAFIAELEATTTPSPDHPKIDNYKNNQEATTTPEPKPKFPKLHETTTAAGKFPNFHLPTTAAPTTVSQNSKCDTCANKTLVLRKSKLLIILLVSLFFS